MSNSSEYRLYQHIPNLLNDLGWNMKSPKNGGCAYFQHEFNRDNILGKKILNGVPEYVIKIDDSNYWVIEAKAQTRELKSALSQAQDRASEINKNNQINCKFITGVAGDFDDVYYIETCRLINNRWEAITINKRKATGLLSPEIVRELLNSEKSDVSIYDIEDKLFKEKITEINNILHHGNINKRNRAGVLACLLLSIANDSSFSLSQNPSILIKDINTRAKDELKKYNKESYFPEISIKPPASEDNHIAYREALVKSLIILKNLNIASTIGCGRDIIGECYELFLKYANDAKEIGVVLTPRHITKFASSAVNVKKDDIVFDPCCGTGGFLVSALDYVRETSGDIDNFKKGNLYGIEGDAFITTLAIVNMVFRGDGNSNIKEGSSFITQCDFSKGRSASKVLMNPPFAKKGGEYEHRFVDVGLSSLEEGGLLFAVLPITTMCSADNEREELTWREELLKRHTLLCVIRLPDDLFVPHANKGTYGAIIKAHRPHNNNQKVLWAIMDDGQQKSKIKKKSEGNITELLNLTKNFIEKDILPEVKDREVDCCPLFDSKDISPERHIGSSQGRPLSIDIDSVIESQIKGATYLSCHSKSSLDSKKYKNFCLHKVFKNLDKGVSGRAKFLPIGNIPLISTSEKINGISNMVSESHCRKIYLNMITISSNGSCCYAAYHDYSFAANPDIFVGRLRQEYDDKFFAYFLCGAINKESWKYDYYKKLNSKQLMKLEVGLPIDNNGNIDRNFIISETKIRYSNLLSKLQSKLQ